MDNLIVILMIILASCILLNVADRILIRGYTELSNQFLISGGWNRLFLVLLTELPLVCACISFMLHRKTELAISGLIGAVCFNLLLVCGVRASIGAIPLNEQVLGEKLSVQILAGIVLIYLAGDYLLHGKYVSRILSRSDGIILVVIYLCYLINEKNQARKKKDTKGKEQGSHKKEYDQTVPDKGFLSKNRLGNGEGQIQRKQIIFGAADIMIGLLMGLICAEMLVRWVGKLEEVTHWEEEIIGLLIIGMGINVRNLISMVYVRKNYILQRMTGNLIEANIMSLFLLIGLVSVVSPVSVSMNMMYDMIFLPLAGSAAWVMAYRKMEWNRIHGCVMLTIYISYMVYAVVR